MKYQNLIDLIYGSSSSRSFFLSLPVFLQIELHNQNEYIRSAAELHAAAQAAERALNSARLGGYI